MKLMLTAIGGSIMLAIVALCFLPLMAAFSLLQEPMD